MLTRPEKIIVSAPRQPLPATKRHWTALIPFIADFDRRFPDTIFYKETGLVMSRKIQSPKLLFNRSQKLFDSARDLMLVSKKYLLGFVSYEDIIGGDIEIYETFWA